MSMVRNILLRNLIFNMVCELEDMGVSIDDLGKKPMGILRAYVGICMDMDKDEAGKEIEAHMTMVELLKKF